MKDQKHCGCPISRALEDLTDSVGNNLNRENRTFLINLLRDEDESFAVICRGKAVRHFFFQVGLGFLIGILLTNLVYLI
jgi:hypothetical protein